MVDRKSVVITGASSGFGAAFARALARDGHNLFICARRSNRLAEVAAGLPAIFYAACDVSQETQVQNFFHQVGERSRSVDAVIHCAAILGPIGTFDSVKSEEWITAVNANVLAAYLVARYALPYLQAAKRPRILMLSGGGAFDPMPNVSAYGVSKAAIVRLVETLAVELQPHDIAVNAVAPGFAATEIHKATLAAGRERGGEHFDKTVSHMSKWDDSMEIPIACIRYMISEKSAGLTGKTISARYDPWDEPEFDQNIGQIVASPLYSTQRTIPEQIANTSLARTLTFAAQRKHLRQSSRSSDERVPPAVIQTALTKLDRR